MRHVMLVFIGLAAIGGGRAVAAPFEPRTVPEQVQAVGHLDVDALRRTQIFAAAGGQTAIDAMLDHAPPELRPIAGSLARTVRGISFWKDGDDGALQVDTGDVRALAKLLTKLPAKAGQAIDGFPVYTLGDGDERAQAAMFGQTLVLAKTTDGLVRSLRVLGGKTRSLAASNKLPSVTRQGVFVFVTLGDDLLGAIQKSTHAKVLQLGIRSLVIDVGENGRMVIANARADMRSPDAVQKARSILDGLRALGTLSNDPQATALLDGVTVTANGNTLEVTAKLPISEIAKVIQAHK